MVYIFLFSAGEKEMCKFAFLTFIPKTRSSLFCLKRLKCVSLLSTIFTQTFLSLYNAAHSCHLNNRTKWNCRLIGAAGRQRQRTAETHLSCSVETKLNWEFPSWTSQDRSLKTTVADSDLAASILKEAETKSPWILSYLVLVTWRSAWGTTSFRKPPIRLPEVEQSEESEGMEDKEEDHRDGSWL